MRASLLFGDYVTLPMKCYGGPNEHLVHEVLSSPFISNSWRNVPIDARDPEEHLHDTSETVVAVRAQGVNPRDAHIFAVRLSDVLPMKGDKWAWQESPLRTRIAELEEVINMATNESNNLRPCPFCGGTNICTEKGINLNHRGVVRQRQISNIGTPVRLRTR